MHATEIEATTVPTTNGEAPLPRRNGPRTVLPSTWLGRTLKLEYTDPSGKAQHTSGKLLDFSPFGPIINIEGCRTAFSWERIAVAELVND
jgi:hypothetical protein